MISNFRKNKNYILWVAYAQTIGIVLVVLGHSFHNFPDNCNGYSFLPVRLIYSFHMPLFIFISGLLLYISSFSPESSHTCSFSLFFKKKFRRLILPYVVLSLVTFFPRALLSGFADDIIDFSPHSIYEAFLIKDKLLIPYFWFLQADFLLVIVFFLIFTLSKRIGCNIIIVHAALMIFFCLQSFVFTEYIAFFSISEALSLGFFFALGMLYGKYHDSIDTKLPWENFKFLFALTALWIISFFILEHSFFFFLCSIFGIMMVISLSKTIVCKNWLFLDHLTGANYLIFLLSWYANVASQQVLFHIVNLPWWSYTILSLFSGIYIPWIFYKYLEKHHDSRWVKFSSYLLGQ